MNWDWIDAALPSAKRGTLRVWGDWFGRPYDNIHMPISYSAFDEGLRFVFNEDEVVDVLARLRRALKDDGILLIDTASTLSVRQLAAEAVKRVIGYYRKPYIFWAWWRTPGFLASLGRKAGFRIGTIYHVRNAGSRRRLYARPRLIQGWPTLRNSHSMLLMSPGR